MPNSSIAIPYYIALREAIKTHKTDLRRLQKEKDALPVVSIRKRRDLTTQMEEKEAEIAKLEKSAHHSRRLY